MHKGELYNTCLQLENLLGGGCIFQSQIRVSVCAAKKVSITCTDVGPRTFYPGYPGCKALHKHKRKDGPRSQVWAACCQRVVPDKKEYFPPTPVFETVSESLHNAQ